MPEGQGRTDPRFYLAAAPLEGVEIPTLFRPGGVLTVLEEPPTLRGPTLGWDLWTLDTPHLVEGRKAFLANGYRKRLALFTGGTLTFVASCVDFLGWPRTPIQFVADPGLNAAGLIELTFNFTLTVCTVRDYMEPQPARLRVWSGFRDLALPSGTRVYLESGSEEDESHVAPAARHDFPERVFDWSDDLPEAAAYALALQTYEWFGFDSSTIPFVDHDRRALDSAALCASLTGGSLSALTAGGTRSEARIAQTS
jgi:hypothetical protein